MRLRASSFGSVAQSYADYRPGYPDEAVAWLAGSKPGRVLELGAGTGKLTAGVVKLGHEVIATDPSAEMLGHVARVAPSARRIVAAAEQIPLPSSSVDVVLAAQALHWFDRERALPEIARVLRPGGVLGTIWNTGDFTVPWVRKVFVLMGHHEAEKADREPHAEEGGDPVEGTGLFTTSDHRLFKHWQQLHRDSLIGLVSSQSYVATRPPNEREAIIAKAGTIYDSYGRGPDGMLLPWRANAYRARVSGLAAERRDGPDDDLLVDFS